MMERYGLETKTTHQSTPIITRMNANNLLYPKLSYIIQGCAFDIRNQNGPGQKEVIYQRLFEEKISLENIDVEREKRQELKHATPENTGN